MIRSLEEFRAYKLAMELGAQVWNIVTGWNHFEKNTVGNQFVRSTDSIAANLAESLGRYHYKEGRNFCYYSRGSLYETRSWATKAFERNLINEEAYSSMIEKMDSLTKMINAFIESSGRHTITP